MRRHEDRAAGYREQAALAAERCAAAVLPSVRQNQARAVAAWETLAETEEAMILAAERRKAALLVTQSTGA